MDDIDVPTAIVVQDLETEIKVFHGLDSTTRAERWPRFAWHLWSKTFLMMTAESGGLRKAPPAPERLAVELARLDAWTAAVAVVARVQAAISGRDVGAEAVRVERSARRYLVSPEGKKRQAYLDARPTP